MAELELELELAGWDNLVPGGGDGDPRRQTKRVHPENGITLVVRVAQSELRRLFLTDRQFLKVDVFD